MVVELSVHRLELLSQLAAGLAAVGYAATLLTRRDRAPLHARLAVFLLVLGVAMSCRAAAWTGAGAMFQHAAYAAFGLFPLPLAVFFEALVKRHLHTAAKLAFLAATLLFFTTAWAELAVTTRWWPLALAGYHSAAVLYLGLLTAAVYVRAGPGPLRSLHGATLLVCAASVALMATDWLYLADLELPRLGAIPVLLLLYYGGATVHSSGEWRLRNASARLALGALAAVAIAVTIELAASGGLAGRHRVFETAGVLVAAGMIAAPFRAALLRRSSQRLDLLVDRVCHLPAGSAPALAHALDQWPEIERAVYLPAGELAIDAPDELGRLLASHGGVVSRDDLRADATLAPAARLSALDQAHFVMDNYHCHHLVALGVGGNLLGVRFALGPDPGAYRRVLSLIAALRPGDSR